MADDSWATLVRHSGNLPQPTGDSGDCHQLIGRQDDGTVAAWVQAVDVAETREHYHRVSAELYYVLEGEGQVLLDGQAHAVRKGSVVHIPPGVIHGARGRMRLLVVGVPFIAEEDSYYLDEC